MKRAKSRDLNLTYVQAAHGVQSAIAFKMGRGWDGASDKHLRVGLDTSKADMLGLAELLISKGVFTPAEYVEAVRLSMNEELARLEEELQAELGVGVELVFR